MSWIKRLAFLPAVGLGVITLVILKGCQEPPLRLPLTERSAAARVITLPEGGVDVVPEALGYGTVAARRMWNAVTQVGGRIVHLNERVRVGAFVKEGTEIVRIDTTDHELEARQAEAQLAGLGAQLEQLGQRKKQYDGLLALERRSLDLARRELERAATLVKQGIDAATSRDAQEREVLRQENVVQQLVDSLALVPSDQRKLEAERDGQKASLERARLNVTRCVIRAPFDCRIATLGVEASQVISAGQVVCSAEGIDVAEIAAHFAADQLAPVFVGTNDDQPISLTDTPLKDILHVTAQVRLQAGKRFVTWTARAIRAETVEPETRTVPIVVAVDEPYGDLRPGRRPPLARGMFVEVALRGKTQSGCQVIPRSALQAGDAVYVADAENRLRSRDARVKFMQGGIAVVVLDLRGGDRIVVSDVVPAIEGQLLEITDDPDVAKAIADEAAGRVAPR